jgi:signal transduction histidine kinase
LAEADHLNDIIKNFLLLANAENNLSTQLTEPVRLDELLWEVQDIFNKQQHGAVNVQLPELPEDEALLSIKTNKTLLVLAVSNIVQNGLKFSSGKTVTCSLHFMNGSIVIRISDQGIGIDPGSLSNIFEPFFRDAHEHNYQGHGIGLYITRKIVDLLGGSISVLSQPGKGSTFNIVFKQTGQF